jgi:uncharacterized protein
MEKRNLLLSPRAPEIIRRGEGDTAPRQIVGYGAVFYRDDDPGSEYVIPLYDGWTLRERIMPGAFDAALKSSKDIIACWNHDTSKPLGRRSKKTLALTVDETGLRYAINPPDTTWGRDALEAVTRGDVEGSSFAFQMGTDVKTSENAKDKTIIREIRSVARLYEVSPVTIPAYESTAAQVRADDEEARAMIAAATKREHDEAAAAQQSAQDLDAKARMGITVALATLVE